MKVSGMILMVLWFCVVVFATPGNVGNYTNATIEVEALDEMKRLDDEIIRVTAEDRPKLIKQIKPQYPKTALKSKIEGKVVLACTTDIYGRVNSVKVVKGHKELSESAVAAVKQWVYQPYILDGVPKPVAFTVKVIFSLDKKKDKK